MRHRVLAIVICLLVSVLTYSMSASAENISSTRQKAQFLVDKGLALNDNSTKEAEYYRKATDVDPTYAEAHFNLGFVCHSLGNLEEAVESYRMCVKFDPARYEAHANLADCLLAVQRDAGLYEVRHHLNKAIELQENLSLKKRSINYAKQKAGLLEIEQRINTILKPVVAEYWSEKEMIDILDRRIRRGGQSLYQGPRLPLLCFQTGFSILSKKGELLLQTLARALNRPELSNYQFIIEGHADGRGKEKNNFTLSRKRVAFVQEWLTNQGGVKKKRLMVVFFGEDHPIFPNSSMENYRYNRRIEIVRRYVP